MENNNPSTAQESKGLSFVEQLVLEDLQAGKNGGRLNTRFPPEPNGYLHIGHAKAMHGLRNRRKIRWHMQPAL